MTGPKCLNEPRHCHRGPYDNGNTAWAHATVTEGPTATGTPLGLRLYDARRAADKLGHSHLRTASSETCSGKGIVHVVLTLCVFTSKPLTRLLSVRFENLGKCWTYPVQFVHFHG